MEATLFFSKLLRKLSWEAKDLQKLFWGVKIDTHFF